MEKEKAIRLLEEAIEAIKSTNNIFIEEHTIRKPVREFSASLGCLVRKPYDVVTINVSVVYYINKSEEQ